MLRIKLAKNIGFCAGVKRAIEITEQTLSKNKPRTILVRGKGRVYSLGPVIHNLEVIKRLEEKGLRVVTSLDKIEGNSSVILPSHGTPQHILASLKKKRLKLIDLTCPYVSSVHKICGMLNRQGFVVVIVGNAKHPEIKTLVDLVGRPYVIEKIGDIRKNQFSHKRIGIISQTTQDKGLFFELVSRILHKNPKVLEVRIFNTICLDTARRQEEVKKLACLVDVLLVIGSKLSANTLRLLNISRRFNRRSYLVQKKSAALRRRLKNAKTVGLISGASTPNWLVGEIINLIKGGM